MTARLEERSRFADLFVAFGPVEARRMFGGYGLYAEGVMLGIAHQDVIYLKTDEASRTAFLAEGCAPFTYRKKDGEGVSLSYYRIPERLYDDPEELADWLRRAHDVARQSAGAKQSGRPGRPRGKRSVRA